MSKVLRYRAEFVAAWILMTLLRMLPLDVASALGGWLARSIGPHLKPSRIARRNIARALPDLDPEQVEQVVRDSWDNLGRVVGEFPHMARIARERVQMVNAHIFDLMRDDGLPGIFVSGHLGNWEVAGGMACNAGIPITLIYRAANNSLVNDLFVRYRAPSATGGQIAKGPDGARDILALLKRGGHIAMLVDQKMNDGIPVPFFGRDAMTAPAAARFAVRFKCPIIPARIERLRGANFRMTMYDPIMITQTADSHDDALVLMTRLNQVLEQWIRENPGQWLWMHKRWPD